MKKISSVILALMMIIASAFAAPCAYADVNTQDTAPEQPTPLALDGSWSAEMDHSLLINSDDWYSFHIDFQGKLNLKMKTNDALDVKIYNASNMNDAVSTYVVKQFLGKEKTETQNVILVAGDYYVKVVSQGKYSLCATFGGNSFVNPQTLNLGNAVSGLSTTEDGGWWYRLAIKDDDKYRFSLASYGTVQAEIYTFDRSKKIETVYVWGDNTAPLTTTKDIMLSSGTYMIKVDAQSEYALSAAVFSPAVCDHIYTVKYVAPTYFAQGYTLHTCTLCGYSYKGEKKSKKKLSTPKLYTLKSGKKKITVSNSQNIDATGYQIKISTSKKFTGKTTKTKKYKNSKNTVKNLKPNKKYYVKVRAYKTKGQKTVYSSWSKTRAVTTK